MSEERIVYGYVAPIHAGACHACGEPCQEFTVPNEAWNTLIRDDGGSAWGEYLCLACFATIAAGKLRQARLVIVGLRTDATVDLIPRASLVAWLRERAQMRGRIGRTWESVGISSVADAIERGDAP